VKKRTRLKLKIRRKIKSFRRTEISIDFLPRRAVQISIGNDRPNPNRQYCCAVVAAVFELVSAKASFPVRCVVVFDFLIDAPFVLFAFSVSERRCSLRYSLEVLSPVHA